MEESFHSLSRIEGRKNVPDFGLLWGENDEIDRFIAQYFGNKTKFDRWFGSHYGAFEDMRATMLGSLLLYSCICRLGFGEDEEFLMRVLKKINSGSQTFARMKPGSRAVFAIPSIREPIRRNRTTPVEVDEFALGGLSHLIPGKDEVEMDNYVLNVEKNIFMGEYYLLVELGFLEEGEGLELVYKNDLE